MIKELWQEICIKVYLNKLSILAGFLTIGVWLVLATWIIPRELLDVIVYICFGWFVLGEVLVPWVERKLNKLFD